MWVYQAWVILLPAQTQTWTHLVGMCLGRAPNSPSWVNGNTVIEFSLSYLLEHLHLPGSLTPSVVLITCPPFWQTCYLHRWIFESFIVQSKDIMMGQWHHALSRIAQMEMIWLIASIQGLVTWSTVQIWLLSCGLLSCSLIPTPCRYIIKPGWMFYTLLWCHSTFTTAWCTIVHIFLLI